MRRIVVGIGAAERVVEADEAAAALQIGLERGLLLGRHAAGVTLVHDDHVGVRDLGGGRKVQRAVHDRAALGQDLAPVGEILRIVVLPDGVRLEPARGCRCAAVSAAEPMAR